MKSEIDFPQTLSQARSGKRDALDQLCDEFYPTVRQIVHRSLAHDLRRNRPWISAMFSTGDVVQEVFRSTLGDLDSFQGSDPRAFVRYLSSIVRNRLLDAIRFHEAARRDRRRMGSDIDPQDLARESAEPVDDLAASELLDRFCRILHGSPKGEQILIRARLERGESFDCIARKLGYGSPDAARKAFHRAQSRLLVRLRGIDTAG